MKIANKLASIGTITRSEAMVRAWKIVKMMYSKTSNELERFTFTKEDGTERNAEGWIRNPFISKQDNVVVRFQQIDGSVRSFRADRLNIN